MNREDAYRKLRDEFENDLAAGLAAILFGPALVALAGYLIIRLVSWVLA